MKAFEKLSEEEAKKAIACLWKNEVKPLNFEVDEKEEVKPIDMTVRDGRRIYQRGLLYIMGKAFAEVYPKALLTVNFQLSNSLYCTVENMPIDEKVISKIRIKMQEIVAKDIEIRKVEMSKEEAEKFYEKERTLRGRLQLDNQYKEEVSLYFCGDYYNYFYGVMPISTGYIKYYDIVKYHDGFLLRYPDKKTPDIIEEYKETKKLLNTLEDYEDIHKILDIDTVYKLNKKIRQGKEKDIILLAEALHEKKIADIADNIVKKKDIKMVLIAGPSSSGKTTFAKRLGIQLQLNGIKPITISVDNYFVEREATPRDENGDYDFECLEAIDLKLFNEHLTKLLNGEEILVPTFNFKTGHKEYLGNKLKLEDDQILVMEGIHCLNDVLTNLIPKENKFKIYISALTQLNINRHNRIATTDARMIRRIVRDNQFRGFSAIKTIEIWPSVVRGEHKYIFPFQEEADVMFNSALVYELGVLKQFAEPLLFGIDKNVKGHSEAERLIRFLNSFLTINCENIPSNSIIREFIGGSCFNDV